MNNSSHHKGCSQSICHNRHGLIKARQSKPNRARCCTDANVAGLLTRNCRMRNDVWRSLELWPTKKTRRISPFRRHEMLRFFKGYSECTSQAPELGSQIEILHRQNNRLDGFRSDIRILRRILLTKHGRHQSHLPPPALMAASSRCLGPPDACLWGMLPRYLDQ